MAIRRMVLADEDTTKKRIESLNDQIKQAQETMKQAKETDPKSERVFNLETRVNNLKSQRDRLKRRADQQKESEKEESAFLTVTDLRNAASGLRTLRVGGFEIRIGTSSNRFTVGVYEAATGKYRRGIRMTFASNVEALKEGRNMIQQLAKGACDRHGTPECQSTLCPESPNFNILTTI